MSKQKETALAPEGSLRAALDALPDYRRGQGRVHPLGGILALAVCAMLCGARSLYAMSQWGQDCGPQIRAALGLSQRRGPSVATLHRVLRGLDHAAFEQALRQWFVQQGLQAGEGIAIDGKPVRGLHGEELPGVHLVAAFAHQTRIVLAQVATGGKGQELSGVAAVLASLPVRLLAGRVVTGDALLAQRDLCAQLLKKRAPTSSC